MERRRWEPFSLTCLSFTLFAATVVWGAEATAATLSLGWNDMSDTELGFKIERRLSGGTFTQIATLGVNTTSYVDTGLADGATYCYQVRAFNAAGNSAPSNEACGTTPASAPQNVTLSVDKTGSGSGTVSGSGISCGTDCSETYSGTVSVTLTATPNVDSTFMGWSGGGCSGTSSCTILTNTDITVTAAFDSSVPPSGPRVVSLTLINADTDQPIAGFDPLPDGATLNFATLPTQNLNLRANTAPSVVGSVRFDLDGVTNYQTENGAPYALAEDRNGDYQAWTPSLGSHTVTAVPYTEANQGGAVGLPLSLTFTVVNESAPQNVAPSVNAGADQTITLPTNSVPLSGSASDDGLPNPPGQLSYTWSQVAGPAAVTFATPTAASTTASFSLAGTYTLRLQVSDSERSASDEVVVTVGPSVTSFTLIDADTDQPIAGFDPLPDGATLNFATLPTQNLNLRANTAPSVVGSVRFDLDGVTNYQTENGAPYALAEDRNGDYQAWTPSLGSHTVTAVPYTEANQGGAVGLPLSLTFTVVNESAPQNVAPSVNAGADQTITLPTNSVPLSGSASDDGLPNPPGQLSYTWSQVAGPAAVTFATPTAASTTASFSLAGTYTLRLQVSDSERSASDEVVVTVYPEPPSGPRVVSFTLINADTDQPIAGFDPLPDGATLNFATLPTQNLNLRANTAPSVVGSVRFDLDGVTNYQTENGAPYALAEDRNGDYQAWTPSLGSHTVTAVPYTEANQGGAVGLPLSLTFTVVNESAPQNVAPSVNAGADQTITLPTNSVPLSGSASDDGLPNPPGQLSYTWSQVAGPAAVTFATPTAASTTASFSLAGTYTLRLQVSDSERSASDEVVVTVGPSVTSFTLIDADTDQPIAGFDPLPDGATLNFATLPTQNLNLRANTAPSVVGSVRFDLDGVTNYQTENGAPYALAEDRNGDYQAWTPSLGSHTVTAVPYTEANQGGAVGLPLSLTFTVVNESARQSSLAETPVEMNTITVNHNWKTIFLRKTFVDPIVVAKPASWNDRDPGVVRLRNITPTSFQIRFQEWDYLDGLHADETVSYVVVERGHWLLPGGGEIEAGSLNTSNSRPGTDPFVPVTFDTPFATTPVVFSTVGTVHEGEAVTTRHQDVAATGFDVILQEQKSGGGHATETIYWLAWELGSGEVEDSIGYEAGSQAGVNDAFSTFTLSVAASCFLADMQTFNEPDTATLRYADLSPIDVKVHVDEEQSLDKKTEHVAETVGYLAFECN